MKRLFLSVAVALCLSTSITAGEIDGTGKTPPPCTQNCSATTAGTQEISVEDTLTLLAIDLLTGLLAAR